MRMPELLRRWSSMAIPLMAQVPEAEREPIAARAIAAKSLLSPGASDEDLAAMKSRLHRRVPDDLRDILSASDGFVIPLLGAGPALFLNSREIGLFRDCAPDCYDAWYAKAGLADPISSGDLLFGEDSEEFAAPAKETLRKALVLSTERDGEVLLACPEAFDPSRKIEDWTYCKLSTNEPNVRFGSLYLLLSHLIDRSLEPLGEFEWP